MSPVGRIERGFTLLELLVVLAIMVILSGVVMATLGPALADARVRASTAQVIAALRYARSHAVSHRTEAAVIFDTERSGISVDERATDAEGVESWQAIGTQGGRFRLLPGGITIAEVTHANTADEDKDGIAVVFSPSGQGEDARITLRDAGGIQRVIVVDAITGRCEIASVTP